MKNLKIFASMEEFEAAKPSIDTPFVVLAGNEVVYSNLVEITEDELDTTEYIDLGLSVKWASCNIGADKPCDYGLLFQFGRVDGYAYGDNQFRTKAQNTADTSSKYIPATTSGKIYAKGDVLDPEDDAAYQATKGKAHMPTKKEIDELLSGTTNQWCQCTVLGEDHISHTVYGILFTSKTNNNKIFIPAAGSFDGEFDSFYAAGSSGYVWSSSIYFNSTESAYYFYFDSRYCFSDGRKCFNGFSVRGVCE